VQRQPVSGADGEALHRNPERPPPKIDSATEFNLLLKRRGFELWD
jgi:hypothetical protein